ncbi:hypothetical protein JCM15764A_16230 [Geotalea toluenoxydans]
METAARNKTAWKKDCDVGGITECANNGDHIYKRRKAAYIRRSGDDEQRLMASIGGKGLAGGKEADGKV